MRENRAGPWSEKFGRARVIWRLGCCESIRESFPINSIAALGGPGMRPILQGRSQ
jgi:hypothetical protein